MLTNITACDSLRKVASGHAEDSRYRYSGIRKQRLPRKRVDDCNGFIRNLSSLCLRREVFLYPAAASADSTGVNSFSALNLFSEKSIRR